MAGDDGCGNVSVMGEMKRALNVYVFNSFVRRRLIENNSLRTLHKSVKSVVDMD